MSFDSNNISDSVREIDVRNDGIPDNATDKGFEDKAIHILEEAKANGATNEELASIYNEINEALLNSYTPIIEKSLERARLASSLNEKQEAEENAEGGFKEMIDKGISCIPGASGRFCQGVIDELWTMVEFVEAVTSDPLGVGKQVLGMLNPLSENFIIKVLAREIGENMGRIVAGDAYEKGRGVTFTVMTVLPFIPKGALLGRLKLAMRKSPAETYSLNKKAILKEVDSPSKVSEVFGTPSQMNKKGITTIDELNEVLDAAKINSIQKLEQIGFTSLDDVALFAKNQADFKKFLETVKPKQAEYLTSLINKSDGVSGLTKVGVNSIDDLLSLKKDYFSGLDNSQFIKNLELKNSLNNFSFNVSDLSKLCDGKISNLKLLLDTPGTSGLSKLKITSVRDLQKFQSIDAAKRLDDITDLLGGGDKLFDNIVSLRPRNTTELKSLGINNADNLKTVIGNRGKEGLYNLNITSSNSLKGIIGDTPDHAVLSNLGIGSLDEFDNFIKNKIDTGKGRLNDQSGAQLSNELNNLGIKTPEALNPMLGNGVDDLISKGLTGITNLNRLGIKSIDDLLTLKNAKPIHEKLIALNLNSPSSLKKMGVNSIEDLHSKVLSGVPDTEIASVLNSLNIKSISDLKKFGNLNADNLSSLGIVGQDKLISFGVTKPKHLAEITNTAEGLIKVLDINNPSLGPSILANFGIKNYKQFSKNWDLGDNGVEIIANKLGIKGIDATSKFGLKTIQDFAKVGVSKPSDLKKFLGDEIGDGVANSNKTITTIFGKPKYFGEFVQRSGETVDVGDFINVRKFPEFAPQSTSSMIQVHNSIISKYTSGIKNLEAKKWLLGVPAKSKSFITNKGVDFIEYLKTVNNLNPSARSAAWQVLKDIGYVGGNGISSVGKGAIQGGKNFLSHPFLTPAYGMYLGNNIIGDTGVDSFEDFQNSIAQIEILEEEINNDMKEYQSGEKKLSENNPESVSYNAGIAEMSPEQQIEAENKLSQIAEVLIKNSKNILDSNDKTFQISLVGLSSKTGNADLNRELAEKRALLGYDFFQSRFKDIFNKKKDELNSDVNYDEIITKLDISTDIQDNVGDLYDPDKHTGFSSAKEYYSQFQGTKFEIRRNSNNYTDRDFD